MLTFAPIRTTTRPDGFDALGAGAVLAVPMEGKREGFRPAPFRTCPRCETTKAGDCFGRNASRKDGLNVWCKACVKAPSHAYYVRTRDRRLFGQRHAPKAISDPDGQRTCAHCLQVKTRADFYVKSSGGKDGLTYWCRQCCRENAAKWHESHPGHIARAVKARRDASPIVARWKEESRSRWEEKARSTHKVCKRCRVDKPREAFAVDVKSISGMTSYCRECLSDGKLRMYYAAKAEVIREYGGECACCGERHQEFLSVDHIRGGWRAAQRAMSRAILWFSVKREGFPKDKYRILCMNCNCSAGFYGRCPHGTSLEFTPRTHKHENEWAHRNGRRLKEEMIREYGGHCICCGESRFEFMTLDHVDGDGGAERRRMGLKGTEFYKWLKHQEWPKGRYRLLCMNCNRATSGGRTCPHRKAVR